MKVQFAGSIPKDPAYPETNEDDFVVDANRSRVAVSDGASESFDSKSWAHLLTNNFVLNGIPDEDGFKTLISGYAELYDFSSLPWSKQAAFERGSFATLLCIEHCLENNNLNIFCVGDSLAVLLDGNTLAASAPYTHCDEFQQRPELFCTNTRHNSFITSPDFPTKYQTIWNITDKKIPTLLCMTDALGEWALRNATIEKSSWEILNNINSEAELERLVLEERENRNMKVDDVTFIRIVFDVTERNE